LMYHIYQQDRLASVSWTGLSGVTCTAHY